MPKADNPEITLADVQVLILQTKEETMKHITNEIKELDKCTRKRCNDIEKKADKANNRITNLIIALVASGTLGGGLYLGIKAMIGG